MPRKTTTRLAVAALCLLIPLLQGGCPDFRNAVVDAVDATTRDVIFGRQDIETSFQSGLESIANAALDLFFDQFRARSNSSGFSSGR